jgi:hypothetical protein
VVGEVVAGGEEGREGRRGDKDNVRSIIDKIIGTVLDDSVSTPLTRKVHLFGRIPIFTKASSCHLKGESLQ